MEVHLSQRTVERLKLRIGELTPRSWGQSLKTCFEGLNEYLRGWFAYFRICTQTGRGSLSGARRSYDVTIIIHQKRCFDAHTTSDRSSFTRRDETVFSPCTAVRAV